TAAPAPAAWAEATVHAALQFTTEGMTATAGASVAAALAEEVLQAMWLTKVKAVLGMTLVATVLVLGAAVGSLSSWRATADALAQEAEQGQPPAEPEKPPEPPRGARRAA